MLKCFDFECSGCDAVFTDYVDGVDGQPDGCPSCTAVGPFKKIPSGFNHPTTIVVDYPGSKRFKAGYTHTHARPAEKKGSQVSMFSTKKD